MKKKVLIPLLIISLVIIGIVGYSFLPGEEKNIQLSTKVMRGDFEIIIPVTGELIAEKSTQIKAPDVLRGRNLRMRNLKIQTLIEEGSVVDSGDWVATLDKSEADNGFKDVLNNLEQVEANFTKVTLDTTIQLRQLRNELINLKFNMEEMKISLEQSMYEPPATIRQVEMNLDKARRAYQQAVTNYELKVIQAKATIREARLNLERSQKTMEDMEIALKNFDIYAPAPGMVIYRREHNGVKRTVGSEINPWDPVVAELPDLSTMVSKTFVNEIDISKIRRGQKVRIGVDAFPEKNYSGEVTSISNIGQQLPNTDAKVFEVLIKIFERDTVLRPSMTTGNKIITGVYKDVNFIPLETLHSNDTISYVFTKKGKRQIVVLGEPNENMIIVEQGLNEGDEIFLSLPENTENFSWDGLELAQIIMKKEAEKAKRIKEMNDSLKRNSELRNGNNFVRRRSGGAFPDSAMNRNALRQRTQDGQPSVNVRRPSPGGEQ